ncbi:MAG TPA: hypothetical protein VMM60_15685 [Ilumatobacter sp.]|nr:hypothetical protein [Ilumatobacter sp.]
MNHASNQSTGTPTRLRTFTALAAAGSLLLLASCGDDDPESAATTVAITTVAVSSETTEAASETTAATPTTEAMSETTEAMSDTTAPTMDAAYCAAAEEINRASDAPTLEQVRAYAELAPDDIAEIVAEVLAAYEEVGDLEALFGDPEFVASIEAITEFENATCGFDNEVSAEPIPDDPFCANAAELNSQDSAPTVEQVEEYAELAPAELAEPVAVVLAALEAADGNFEAIFSDPAVGPALGEITDFEAEYCGFEDDESASDTELDPNAIRIDVDATDYMFDMELPVEAGRYSFVMTNNGAEPHLMIFLQLEEDAVLDEVMESEGEEGVIEFHESDVAFPGTEAIVTLDMEPGRWIMICPIPNAEDVPHLALGMIHEFTIE